MGIPSDDSNGDDNTENDDNNGNNDNDNGDDENVDLPTKWFHWQSMDVSAFDGCPKLKLLKMTMKPLKINNPISSKPFPLTFRYDFNEI